MAKLATSSQSTRVTPKHIEEIVASLRNIKGWGSVEIFIQQGKITQITERNIRKTR